MTMTYFHRAFVAGLGVWLLTSAVGFGQANNAMQDSAVRLAATLQKSGLKKVAVVPLSFVLDTRADQNDRLRGQNDKTLQGISASAILSASRDSLMVAEQMQRNLAEAGGGDLIVVPSEDLFERLSKAGERIAELTPTGKELAGIVNPDGDIEAIVVGTVRKFYGETTANAGHFLQSEQKSYAWDVIRLSDRTILDSKSINKGHVSLAEAVYNGLSAEYFRYLPNGKLQCLLNYEQENGNVLPLRPSNAEALYTEDFVYRPRVHPLLNPNCPFKVQFLVKGKVLPVHVVTQKGYNFSGGEVHSILGHVAINLEPGEEPRIRVSNTCSHRVMVAMFVDGINILGKARELPDESCRAWALAANKKAEFRSWWTGDSKTPVQEEGFIVEDWEDSVAGRMGLPADADSARAITLVFFTDGMAQPQNIQLSESKLVQNAFLTNLNRHQVTVTEEWQEAEFAGAAPGSIGIGKQESKGAKFDWVRVAGVGTILASMHVLYCPSSETETMLKRATGRWDVDGVKIVPVSTSY